MQIIVLGAGAIGSLYGAKLALAGHDVLLVGRADHVSAINSHGLQIEGLETRTVAVPAATRVERIGPDTLILLTTKVPASKNALDPLVSLLRADTTIFCLQNGLGSEEIARAVVSGRALVLRGITQAGAIFERPGAVKYMLAARILIEPHERSEPIAGILIQAGLDCRVSSDIKADIWAKLIFNCVVNPITTILGSEVCGIADPALDPLKQLVIDECLAVAAAEDVRLAIDFNSTITETFAPSRNIVSMLQDIRRGRPTEIDYMNGAVAALAAKHGLPSPVNRALTDIIKAMETPAARKPL